ncbi:probable phosphoglycerate mutase [Paenibacillus uliginis N3/975]|uniref:Probable phosphoglycerate mutase n=1 Tax=Paenibacillus uliginis N3/975 TaxID=1313296 RepID=A0A1X7HN26_9BACL|nr:histidine phosphatase family protein [Paenibacillus uliginis]SMF88878.1 probable phosphoglycerate mutase [Paenibacillus uliginis N3/975]
MAIYLVRHGNDEPGFRGGWSNRGLTQEGIQQSERLGQYLLQNNDRFNIERIITSDLKRALQTSTIIAKQLNLPTTISEDWRETNNGLLAGMPNALAEEKYPGLYFSSLRMDERYPGGESPIENFRRITEAFTTLCQNQTNTDHTENVMVVTHGGVINIIYHIVKNIEWSNKNTFIAAANTGLHKVEYRGGEWELTLENSTDHIR